MQPLHRLRHRFPVISSWWLVESEANHRIGAAAAQDCRNIMATSALRELDKLRKMLEPSSPSSDRPPETPHSARSDRSGLNRRMISNMPELQQAEVTLVAGHQW